MVFCYSLILVVIGVCFDFPFFSNNDFMVLWMTFWMFQQAMVGVANVFVPMLSDASMAVYVGVVWYAVGSLIPKP